MVNEKNIGIGIVILAVVFILFSSNTFLGTVVTTCDNTEPGSFEEFVSAIDLLDGTVNRDGNFNLVKDTGLVSYPFYRGSSNLGLINVIDSGSLSCSDFLKEVSETPYSRSAESGADIFVCEEPCNEGWTVIDNHCVYNECFSGCSGSTIYTEESACIEDNLVLLAEYTLINKKQVLSTNDGFMWCNQDNNVVLFAPTISAFTNYFDEFETCTEEEVVEISAEDACYTAGGEWTLSACYCGDVLMGEEDLCSPVYVPPSVNESSTPITIPGYDDDDREDVSPAQNVNTLWIIAAIFVGLFALYWFFEKGPDKGLFQIKKKRRRKK